MKKKNLLFTAIAILSFATATMAQVPSYVPTNGLVSAYIFSGNANNVYGTGTNGIVSNATLTTDRLGNTNSAYSFNGTNSSIDLGINTGINGIMNDFSISYWVYNTNTAIAFVLASYSNQGGSYWRFNSWLNVNYVKSGFLAGGGAGTWQADSTLSNSVPLNTWTNISIVRSGGVISTYINSMISSTNIISTSSLNNPTSPYASTKIGYDFPGGNNKFFNGKIDDIYFYNRALTPSEITGLYNGGNTNTVPVYVPANGLVGWWPFSGNANDLSGNNNNGTVNGATLATDRFGISNSAYSFNGTNNKIIVADSNSLDVTATATFSLWTQINQMNFDAGGSDDYDARLLDKTSPGLNNGYLIDYNHRITSSNPNYSNQCTTGSTKIRTILGIPINLTNCYAGYLNWTHIVVTFNNGSVKIYNNGILSGTFTNSNSVIPTNSIPLVFGYQTSGSANTWLNGKLDDIGIWNRTLDSTEILGLFNGNLCYQYITVTDTLVINTNIIGFNPITYQNTIKVWPNPTKDHITIDNGNIANMVGYQLKITNSLGQQVFQSAINQQQFYVDLATWTGNGIYFVYIINGQGQTIDIKKIVLQ
ncbi:MAG: LamG-like jellyroll fold domain-containing protein [Bacteroidales bacterium]